MKKTILSKIFRKDKNILIGAIHLPSLLGYPGSPELKVAISNALKDLRSLEKGGVDGIIFENNYDVPHKIFVDSSTIVAMTIAGKKIKESTKLPVGISVLWNDYKTALSISKLLGLQFIRIPVFVDKVKTSYGIVDGVYKEAVAYRSHIQANTVAMFTDIHVKHAKLLSKYSLISSAKLAIQNKSDGIIITGKWTGDAPNTTDLQKVRKAAGEFPILCGSGVDEHNVKGLFKYANGAIVSTSLKDGRSDLNHVNVKAYAARISEKKTARLVQTANAKITKIS